MKNKNSSKMSLAMLAPIYIFTIVFVALPIIYMFVLSFLKQAESWGVVYEFTFKNYLDILEPIYLTTFIESFKLAVLTTLLVIIIGYPFGYFMAKLSAKWRGRMMLLLMVP